MRARLAYALAVVVGACGRSEVDFGTDEGVDSDSTLVADAPVDTNIAVDSGSDAAADTALDSVDDVVREADVAIDSGVDIGPEIAADAIDSAPVDAVADTRMDVPSTCSWKGLSPAVSYAAGGSPWSVTTADFDRDGHVDIAAANSESGSVSVWINRGDGTFAPQRPYVATAVPRTIATADLDGDGYADLATASSGVVSVLINARNGTFLPPKDYPFGVLGSNSGFFIALADVNGDAHTDIVMTDYVVGAFSVMINRGDGTFAPPVTYASPNAGPIVLADFNGDGALDMAIGDDLTSKTEVIRLFSNNGIGAFTAGASYSFLTAGESDYGLLAAGNITGKGYNDLVVTDGNDNLILLYANEGNGVFAAPMTFDAQSAPTAVIVADMNGDGTQDIAFTSPVSEVLSVMLNPGDGLFAPPTTYLIGSLSPANLGTGDFNGDGLPDLVTANFDGGSITVFLSDCH